VCAVLPDERWDGPASLAQGEESILRRDHRRGPLVDSVDDLGAIDPADTPR
jgi:hypothetical protein